ncbi:NAD-dependent deacylase [candidate division KSB3 bacterium]|uniref:protein acetyllysine N-acetyltransferase n=1 Tax=candidate division KSB3 bacterium TaxID=2044937 RepID=A0A9D5Q6J0_9BACT|nr:NAD-dependent deacylase [candidate division KSB3 bacterium]MBD3325904.1 NAD-dependent deacylase [candidate division KSB3 bacterium]
MSVPDIAPIDFSSYTHIAVLTGAGISVASGLRTYRGEGGIWEEHDIEKSAYAETLWHDPTAIWKIISSLRQIVQQTRPNAAHLALAQFASRLRPDQTFSLITQNVDGLHRRAGNQDVIEIHGNAQRTRCRNDACPLAPFDDVQPYIDEVPHCPECGDPLRPDVVLFGEFLPPEAQYHAQQAVGQCDLFMAVGTSGTVYPAAGFVQSARNAGARTILVNLEPMDPPNPAFQEEYLGKAEELLPRLLA